MKKAKTLTALATAAMVALIFTFTACNKKDKTTNTASDDDKGYAQDHILLEKSYDDAQSISDQAATTGGLSNFRTTGGATTLSNCATITHDTLSSTHTVTVDFGASNCLCGDGKYRRGQVICTYTGHYKDSASTHTITFNNYFVNDNQVTGTKTVTNMGTNSAGQYYYDISVNGSVILANGAGTRTWTSTRTRTWVNGYNTPTWSDDEYEITGSANVTRASGNTFMVNITNPLHIALNCQWIESGTVTITPQNGNVRTLDYGSGTCDAEAQLTVNGTTYNISL